MPNDFLPPPTMLQRIWLATRPVLGWALLIIGLIGLIVPGPGIPLIVVGIALIGRRHPRIRQALVGAKLHLRGWARKQGARGWLGTRGKQILHRLDAQLRRR